MAEKPTVLEPRVALTLRRTLAGKSCRYRIISVKLSDLCVLPKGISSLSDLTTKVQVLSLRRSVTAVRTFNSYTSPRLRYVENEFKFSTIQDGHYVRTTCAVQPRMKTRESPLFVTRITLDVAPHLQAAACEWLALKKIRYTTAVGIYPHPGK